MYTTSLVRKVKSKNKRKTEPMDSAANPGKQELKKMIRKKARKVASQISKSRPDIHAASTSQVNADHVDSHLSLVNSVRPHRS